MKCHFVVITDVMRLRSKKDSVHNEFRDNDLDYFGMS